MNRKELKAQGKKGVKRHYWIFVIACLITSFLGADFALTLVQIETITTPTQSNSTLIIQNLLQGNFDDAESMSEDFFHNKENNNTNIHGLEVGYKEGVFASAIKWLHSGSIYLKIFKTIQTFSGSDSPYTILFFSISLILISLAGIFIENNYRVAYRRVFLEGQHYKSLSFSRFAFLLSVRKLIKPALTLFVTILYKILWSLTIIGGIIKYYSYFLVPYIVAENPDISPNKAITLSRKMMNGHKWECFVLQLSFWGWDFLGIITLGILNIFYTNPYKECCYCRYYEHIRNLSKKKKIENIHLLNDIYLYKKAARTAINEKYSDVMVLINKPLPPLKKRKGFGKFMVNFFGIVPSYNEQEKLYNQQEERRLKIKSFKDAIEQKVYPHRLNPLFKKDRKQANEHIHYMRHYSITSIILMFFTLSFVGWIWEVCFSYIQHGIFVNRGVLHGPWLPIYGSGSILILLLLNKFRSKPLLEFISAFVLCGFVEYFTALFLEKTHNGQRWWDYTGYFLNLNGRICAEGLLLFAFGGIAIVYLIAPLLDNAFRKIRLKAAIPICIALIMLFAFDEVFSAMNPNTGRGITDYEVSSNISQKTTNPSTVK